MPQPITRSPRTSLAHVTDAKATPGALQVRYRLSSVPDRPESGAHAVEFPW